MSFGTQPSTMTVDPTPPGLRPLQNQLVQMLMGRMSGQGRTTVPTYGSTLGNIQQQLYGVDPRTPPQTVSGNPPAGNGPNGPRTPPTSPRFTPMPAPLPTYGETLIGGFGQPNDINPTQLTTSVLRPAPTMGDPITPTPTRGSLFGGMQGSMSPWAMPTFGALMNGSGLIRANNSPYGWRL